MEKSIGPMYEHVPVHKWQVDSVQKHRSGWGEVKGQVTLKVLAVVMDRDGNQSYEYVHLALTPEEADTLLDHLHEHARKADTMDEEWVD